MARPIIFILFTLLTCCCRSGATVADDFKFEDRILSFDFVEYELGMLNNFEDHPVGREEFEFNRRLSFVRAQSIRGRPPPNEQLRRGNTALQKIQNKIGGTVLATFSASAKLECTFCFCELLPGEWHQASTSPSVLLEGSVQACESKGQTNSSNRNQVCYQVRLLC